MQNLTKLFDMRDGYAPIRNILGLSDPSVHYIDNQWVMFIGGYNTSLKTNIYSLRLPKGDKLNSNNWQLDTVEGKPQLAAALIQQPTPEQSEWDGYGLHSPSYVKGKVDGHWRERIYYAGQSSKKITDNDSPYKIGFMEKTADGWQHQDRPLDISGDKERPNVLEPKVEYLDGKWHMRYAMTPVESSKHAWPDYTIMHTESDDGVNWSMPTVFFSNEEGYFDSVVVPFEKGYGMAVTRNSNLYGRSPFPPQGIWWLTAPTLSSRREDWTREPIQLLDPATDTDGWYRNGMCGPTLQFGNTSDDQDTIYIFFAGTTERTNWFTGSLRRILQKKGPLPPAPYFLTIGRLEVPKSELSGESHPRVDA